jgi:hypothetical protein
MTLADKIPQGRGVSDKAIQDKYEKTLEAIPESEQEKTLKSAIGDIQDIIKTKEVPPDIADLYPKWKVGDFAEYLKYIKGDKEVPEEKEKPEPEEDSSSKGLSPEMVRLFFMAPDDPSTKTITPEGNFQWVGYELLFKKNQKHYKYRTPLWAYGDEAEGDQTVVDSENEETKDLSLDQVKDSLKKYRMVYPAGLSGFYYNVPESLAKSKFDVDQWIRAGKKYTFSDFDKKFRKSGFYKLVNKGKKLENP